MSFYFIFIQNILMFFAQAIKTLKIFWESRRTVELHMPPLACPDLALVSSCPPLRVQFIAALLSSAWLGLGGTTTGMMAVNFRLFTTQDWSLTSEWTHLNTERAFDPNFTPGFLLALFFLQPS